ncbi:MAG: DUF342 domain-containing protein [Deltaproteobacteria bacterium]|nr:DUF342 domain-containing protein [Deltaproteobacteria bacterium]
MKKVFEEQSEHFKLTAHASVEMLKLFIDVEGKATKQELLDCLTKHVPADLLNEGVIADIATQLKSDGSVKERRVAKGVEAQPGADGKLLLLVQPFKGKGSPYETDSQDAVAKRKIFDNIEKGQIIARIYEPKPGTPGIDVLGNPIKPTPGKAPNSKIAKTILREKTDKNYDVLIAGCDGYLQQDGNNLTVQDTLKIEGDLDHLWGSLQFVGSIKVSGDVLSGITIRANKDIEIAKGVQGASLFADEGSIIVRGFVFGDQQSELVSSGNIQIKGGHQFLGRTKQYFVFEKELIDCVIHVGGTVHSRSGIIIGGEIYTVCGLEAAEIGTKDGQETKIHLCTSIEASWEYQKLLKEIRNHDQAIELLNLKIGPALKVEKLKDKLAPMLEKLEKIKKSKTSLEERLTELEENAKSNSEIRVNFLKSFYPWVTLHAKDKQFSVDQKISGPKSIVYRPEDETFSIEDYQTLTCEILENKEEK